MSAHDGASSGSKTVAVARHALLLPVNTGMWAGAYLGARIEGYYEKHTEWMFGTVHPVIMPCPASQRQIKRLNNGLLGTALEKFETAGAKLGAGFGAACSTIILAGPVACGFVDGAKRAAGPRWGRTAGELLAVALNAPVRLALFAANSVVGSILTGLRLVLLHAGCIVGALYGLAAAPVAVARYAWTGEAAGTCDATHFVTLNPHAVRRAQKAMFDQGLYAKDISAHDAVTGLWNNDMQRAMQAYMQVTGVKHDQAFDTDWLEYLTDDCTGRYGEFGAD
jgi:hypothetical protein